jgi:glycosyltransferase involved in cell wall biosynthesis
MPLFSVIVATYNRAALLPHTIASIMTQRCTDFELIIANDGSTDDTAATAARIATQYPDKIRVLNFDNGGPAVVRNRAVAHATGTYLAFMDDDDLWFPWTLATYAAVFEKYDATFTIGPIQAFNAEAELSAVREQPLDATVYPDYLASLRDHFFRAGCVWACQQEAFNAVGGFPNHRLCAEDHDLFYRLGTMPTFVHINAPLMIGYRKHGGSISSSTPRGVYDGLQFLLRQEADGKYPGGAARQAEREHYLAHTLRDVSWHAQRDGKKDWAWDLFRKSFRWNLKEMRLRYLLAFPVLGVLRSGRKAPAS